MITFEEGNKILSKYLQCEVLPDEIKLFDWASLSKIKEPFPKEVMIKFKEHWDFYSLINNPNIHWDKELFDVFCIDNIDNKFKFNWTNIYCFIQVQNIDLNSFLNSYANYIKICGEKGELDFNYKAVFSQRNDLNVDILRKYNFLFEFLDKVPIMDKKFYYTIYNNKSIKLDYDFIYDFSDKINFWFLAQSHHVTHEIIENLTAYFDVMRAVHIGTTRISDFGPYQQYRYVSAWENLLKNPNLDNKKFILEKFGERKIRYIDGIGENDTLSGNVTSEDLLNHIHNARDNNSLIWLKIKDLKI